MFDKIFPCAVKDVKSIVFLRELNESEFSRNHTFHNSNGNHGIFNEALGYFKGRRCPILK